VVAGAHGLATQVTGVTYHWLASLEIMLIASLLAMVAVAMMKLIIKAEVAAS
jgi:NADH:ubiquinone oxidoreductase subunit K